MSVVRASIVIGRPSSTQRIAIGTRELTRVPKRKCFPSAALIQLLMTFWLNIAAIGRFLIVTGFLLAAGVSGLRLD